MRDDQSGPTSARVEPDAGTVANLEDVSRLEVRHIGRDQQGSLAGNSHLQHIPVFLVAQRVDATTNKRVRVITGQSEGSHAADGANQGLRRVHLDLELTRQDECQAVEHAKRDYQLQRAGLAGAGPNRIGQPR